MSNNIFDTPVQPEPQEVVEEETKPTIADLLFKIENAPDEATLEQWKQKYGEVFCSGFSETEMFVFRPLGRQEWVQLQSVLQNNKGGFTEQEVESQVVTQCVLWSSNEGMKSLEQKAGSLTTLHEQVMQSSNFVNPVIAAQLVMKL